jgi:hypothetical protein
MASACNYFVVLCHWSANTALKRTRREASFFFAGVVPARRLA